MKTKEMNECTCCHAKGSWRESNTYISEFPPRIRVDDERGLPGFGEGRSLTKLAQFRAAFSTSDCDLRPYSFLPLIVCVFWGRCRQKRCKEERSSKQLCHSLQRGWSFAMVLCKVFVRCWCFRAVAAAVLWCSQNRARYATVATPWDGCELVGSSKSIGFSSSGSQVSSSFRSNSIVLGRFFFLVWPGAL